MYASRSIPSLCTRHADAFSYTATTATEQQRRKETAPIIIFRVRVESVHLCPLLLLVGGQRVRHCITEEGPFIQADLLMESHLLIQAHLIVQA